MGLSVRKTTGTEKYTQELDQDDPRLCSLGVAHVPFACEFLQEESEGRRGLPTRVNRVEVVRIGDCRQGKPEMAREVLGPPRCRHRSRQEERGGGK